MLHAFHGVNPLGFIYLTNMGAAGGEVSATRLWHDWFPARSVFGSNPPPGYVVGGPNATFGGRDGPDSTTSIEWVSRQPPEKAYADSNAGYPQKSWEMSEPAIYYQAAYIRLLANFVPPAATSTEVPAALPGDD
jgi:endoglucanase